MNAKAKRIAVGQIFQESHDFNPVLTSLADFVIEHGADAVQRNWNAGSTFGGILQRLSQANVDIRGLLAARARPGGSLERGAYQVLKAEMLSALAAQMPVDAVVLELHGAMTASGVGSTEGDLVSAIRSMVGPQVIISVGLDLHGHASDALLGAANIVTACKHHPHTDIVDTGHRAASLALAALDGSIRPVTAMTRIPLVLRGGYETHDHPLCELHREARLAIARSPGQLLDVSIFNIQPFLDVAGMGQSFVAITDGDARMAGAIVSSLARECWNLRDQFVDDMMDLDAALDTIEKNADRRPYVLSDYGDRVLGGAPGDSIEVLRALQSRGSTLSCAIPVTDPQAVRVATAAGVGARIRVAIGGTLSPSLRPLEIEGTVVSVSDGDFVQRGPYMSGQRTTLGRTAVIQSGRNWIIVTTVAGMTQDPNAFTSQGIDIGSLDFVVTKSGNAFKMSFAGIAEPIVAATPGLSLHKPGTFALQHARVYPDHAIANPTATVAFFPAGTMQSQTIAL